MTLTRALLVVLLLNGGCGSDGGTTGSTRQERLGAAMSWMYQLSGLDEPEAIAAVAASEYPLLVLEPGQNHRPCSEEFDPEAYGIPPEHADEACATVYDSAAMVETLRTTPGGEGRLLLAYIDIGQAEWYRDYWVEGWAPPTEEARGIPDFMLTADPDGWTGNFVVAYWDEAWQALWLGAEGTDGIVAELARLGFDGVYLDWVEAYDDDVVQAAAEDEGLDPANEMVGFVERIRAAGRAVTPDFLVVAQNATFLLDDTSDPDRYAAAIDALAAEDTWYYGNGSTDDWNAGDGDDGPWDISDRLECEQAQCPVEIVPPDNVCPDEEATESCLEEYPVSGDLHGGSRHACPEGAEGTSGCWSTENRLEAYGRYQDRGLPVLTIDYCIGDDTAGDAYARAREHGLRPLVTRVQLSRMTETPPGDYE